MRLKARKRTLRLAASFIVVGAICAGAVKGFAQSAPAGAQRIALVIGESAYKTGPLSSAANDAGLIADTLTREGFDVTGAADLDQDGLRKALREFVEKATAAGPDAIAFVYISGRGLQYAGDNYIAPVEASVPRATNAPLEAVRLTDYLQPLSQLPLKAQVVVLDAARINSFAQTGDPLASGLALVEPNDGGLYAFNAAPGSVAPDETAQYGVYAQALAEALRQPGLPLDQAFNQTRLRVSELTKGAVIPWSESKLAPAPVLLPAAPGAPPPAVEATVKRLRARPIREYPVDEAFAAALERDSIQGYEDFVAVYPNTPYSPRARAVLAVRREAISWRRAWDVNTPNAYWTYLQLYPHGPHAFDARRRLAVLSAPPAPPANFDIVEFDVPPPPPAETVYFRRPYVVFDDPEWGPPPPPPDVFLPPPVAIVDAAPPPPPALGLLPLPVVVAPIVGAALVHRMGAFRAPTVVQNNVTIANTYYNNATRQVQAAPLAPSPGAPPPTPGRPGAPAYSPATAQPQGQPAPGAQAPAAPVSGPPQPQPA
ncbi:MAG TPA: caspase family protein, partial [Rhodoblastus sp.]|nr:caspase family protein [Rhodoblastus sp.]